MVLREEGARTHPECPLLVAFEDMVSFYDVHSGKRVRAVDTPDEAYEYEQHPDTRLNDGRFVSSTFGVW